MSKRFGWALPKEDIQVANKQTQTRWTPQSPRKGSQSSEETPLHVQKKAEQSTEGAGGEQPERSCTAGGVSPGSASVETSLPVSTETAHVTARFPPPERVQRKGTRVRKQMTQDL